MGEKAGFLPYPEEFETICIQHYKQFAKKHHNQLVDSRTPIVMSNLIRGKDISGKQEYVKGRLANPTRSILENLLATLNRSKYCLTFCSGIGAISAVLGLLKCGDHIVVSDDVYGGTNQLLTQIATRFGIGTSFVDFYDYNKLQEAITSRTKLLWTENPTNPKLKVIDLEKCSKIASENNIIMAVDNSLLTPYLQRPLDWGVHVSIQAVTKYLNGHSDIIMGEVSTNDEGIYRKLKFIQTHYGHIPSPFDCYQVIRSIKTLPLRLRRHHFNSLEVAKFLMDHPKIESVQHPAHPSHSKHKIFKCQASGHSGMVAFYVKGNEEQTKKFMSSLNVFATAVSMGGYESLLETPYHLSHKVVSEQLKKHLKYTPNLIRMSVGLEDVSDLIADLDNALNKI